MSAIQILITPTDFKTVKRMLRKPQEVICADPATHLRTLLVVQQMLYDGDNVKATITKGYKEL